MTASQESAIYERLKELGNNDGYFSGGFTDAFGNPISESTIDDYLNDSEVQSYVSQWLLQNNYVDYRGNMDLTEEQINDIVQQLYNDIQETRNIVNTAQIADEIADEMAEYEANSAYEHYAWDPRLSRMDSFYMGVDAGDGFVEGAKIVIPFGSDTIATAFADMTYMLPAKVAKKALEAKSLPSDSTIDAAASNGNGWNLVPVIKSNADSYANDEKFYGAASLMNPYSLTKLMGSFELSQGRDGLPQNYMYDIRDTRRFYGISDDDQSVTQVSSPTVTHIIEWANKDIWGRTPYSYQDFVYCKWFGVIPNNRLITLRRYHAPTRDNLQFEQMFGEDPAVPKTEATTTKGAPNVVMFAPRCTVVSYIGQDTGNTFESFMKFSTGINWGDVEAQIWNVDGEDGSDPQATIDRMFESGGFGGADNNAFNSLLHLGSNITNKILSFGKMATAINGNVTLSEGAQYRLMDANINPYEQLYSNRIQGPLNRINSVKRRTEGIIFDSTYQVTCTYVTKAIGGINPKAAMLDILANCMEMVSPTAIFWGGGHRFMIKPHMYPFHDSGWRDSFMKKLYDGKVFGDDGAISYVLKGLKNFGTNGGDFDWSNITSKIGGILGTGLACISSLVSSVSSALFGESSNVLSDILNKGAEGVSGQNAETLKARANNAFRNLNTMWHSKVLAETVAPQISSMNALLIGDPVGEWHLTVGNPLNPIMVIGNLICERMEVSFNEELGPDDFPTELTVVYSLQHGMQRDKKAIQSMFNRGMGAIYELPDYIRSSSEMETHVDNYTGGATFRTPGFMHVNTMKQKARAAGDLTTNNTYQNFVLSPGKDPSNAGNYVTQIVTKFSGIANSNNNMSIGASNNRVFTNNNMATVRALAITRKFTS